MTFQQLQYVSEVAHLGSINRAAHKLFVSQSSVSNTIKALETELGIQIFHRRLSVWFGYFSANSRIYRGRGEEYERNIRMVLCIEK